MLATLGASPRVGRSLGHFLKLLDGRHDRFPGWAGQKVSEIPDAFGSVGIRKAAVPEGSRNLVVEINPVRDDDDGRVVVEWVAAKLQSEPEHREAFPGPLRVPDDAPPLRRFLRRSRTLDGFVDGAELLISGDLLYF